METQFLDYVVETKIEMESEDEVIMNIEFYENELTDDEYLTLTRGENAIEKRFKNINEINKYFGNENCDFEEFDCSICLNKCKKKESARKIKKCNHIFHKKCINNWLLIKPTCPNCRINLL